MICIRHLSQCVPLILFVSLLLLVQSASSSVVRSDKRSQELTFSGGLSAASARRQSLFRRDDTSASPSSFTDTTVPSGYTAQLAYFSPNISQVADIAQGKSTAADLLQTYRQTWVDGCSGLLRSSSPSFVKNETFGWFIFTRDFDAQDQVNDGVIVVRVTCYETTAFDPTGIAPGMPIKDQTGALISQLDWTKESAKAAGEDLIKQYLQYNFGTAQQAQSSPSTADMSSGSSSNSQPGMPTKRDVAGRTHSDVSATQQRKRRLPDSKYDSIPYTH